MLYFCLIRTVPQSIAVTLRGKKGAEVLLRCVKGKAGKVVMRSQKLRELEEISCSKELLEIAPLSHGQPC
jgi:hypothetical protein